MRSFWDACSISIHALREEGDGLRLVESKSFGDFYPRPPRGGRPVLPDGSYGLYPISIHALREEGDVCSSPHAGHHKGFLSTPSARRAT